VLPAAPTLFITPGEPAGIGIDIALTLAQKSLKANLVFVADPQLMQARAEQLNLTFNASIYHANHAAPVAILPVSLLAPVTPGKLDVRNSAYVIQTLQEAVSACRQSSSNALVTGPVHKGIINDAGIAFTGHTEWLCNIAQVDKTIMLFVVDNLKVVLLTTHLPLKDVSAVLTTPYIVSFVQLLNRELKEKFALSKPRLSLCGLNPHAGEDGHFGREEIEHMQPAVAALQALGIDIDGTIPADTAFTQQHLQNADVVIAAYHDQALPLIKHIGFDRAVNITLGLPFIRTSVDHGTALSLAGSGLADAGSMMSAAQLALKLITLRARD